MRSRDIICSSFSDLVDHLHDLEELHERLIHLVRVLKIRMICDLVVKSQNLEVDAVASLFNGTKELCIVFCLHVVFHHFHLRILG